MLRVIYVGFKCGLSEAKKSPLNFWLSALVNFSYYIAQGFFWYAILNSQYLGRVLSSNFILIFFITVCLVDNFYLFLFGKGSFLLVKKVRSLKLEPHLTLPINTQFLYITTNIAFEHFLLSFLSLVLFFIVHIYLGTAVLLVFLHLIMSFEGVLILTSITWIIRSTIFWTASLVSIKNSNPCFKVLVRPEQSFHGAVRFVLMFILPCLFITGIPASVAGGVMSIKWFFIQSLVTLVLIFIAKFVFDIGIKRYSKYIT
ncbi:ABC-2 family transporter protein [Xenorhabdus griffiniae]|uniref:ABC-2 family transporter protein n=1 Tax=Xenorhabdus griffiniae TaxID=351672 RepID=UPI002358D487|nr:ABC-2 family transporter protein [Xenorhabdus griffiniae]MDC9605283.1 ABC-2 family transporter protein [Xenorhabdus griffiniae]